MKSKRIILITGPTASGKTDMAIDLATRLQTEIISADSRQCYREMNIGVAKPAPSELAKVRHHFISSHSIFDNVNAVVFEEYALQIANSIFLEKDVAVMVGGTGLYIRAFTDGLDEIPEIPPSVRSSIVNDYRENGLHWLQEQIRERDTDFYHTGETLNPQRLMRALEVKIATGRSIADFHKKKKNARPFEVIKYAIDLPKERLHKNIETRTGKMIGEGLEKEVRELLPHRHLNALQTVGYNELFDFFDGKISLDNAIGNILTNTRRYAKRQMTWFRKDSEIKWIRDISEISI